MDSVQQFIQDNIHQLGYIMGEASRVWIERDPIGALTVGHCNFVVQHNGDYETLLKKIEELEFSLKQCRVLASKIVDIDEAHYEATRIIEIVKESSGARI